MPAVHRFLVCRSEYCGLRITGSVLRIAFLPSTMMRNTKGMHPFRDMLMLGDYFTF